MLTVLEALGPTERAVFVLREVFDVPYDEIADAVGKSPAAVRQIAHRARGHVVARRPRMDVDPGEQAAVVERFLAAVTTGDMQALMDVLAPDVIAIADGGGLAPASRTPIVGAERLASLLIHYPKVRGFEVAGAHINGMPGARLSARGASVAVSLVVVDGRITHIYGIANPEKLGHMGDEVELRR